MKDMQDLADAVRDLEDQLGKCTRCGMCQSVCPVFSRTRKEADVSRGKLALLEGLMEGLFDNPEGVNQRLNKCLLCGSCQSNCSSNVNVLSIFLQARSIITQYRGMGFYKQVLFKQLLSRPRFFKRLIDLAGLLQPLFLKQEGNRQGTSCARIRSPLVGDRHVIPVSEKPFHKRLQDISPVSNQQGIRIAFFTGCLIDSFFPGIAHAAMQVFNHFSLGCVVPANQGCCGIPALASGDIKTFETLVTHHVRIFSEHEFDYLVTACATCTSTIKKFWPTQIRTRDAVLLKQVEDIARKTVDISWLLVHRTDLLEQSTNEKPNRSVTYHDPCHLKKSLGIHTEPRQVIKSAGYAIHEMAEPDACCGMGGSFNLSYYDLSREIGQKKGADIIRQGCDIVSTSCPACMLQISDVLASMGENIYVRHPVELLAESLNKKCQV